MLAIFAHPDDESFAAGGTLAKYAHQDVQVVLLCATRGEAGLPRVNPKLAGDIRESELRQAAQHLGIEVHFMSYPDGGLSNTPPENLLETIAAWIDLIQPQVILTFGPEGVSGHPDHVTISHIVTQAYDLTYKKGLLLYIRPSEAIAPGSDVSLLNTEDEKPLIEIDISGYKLEKVRAIKSHASQNPRFPGRLEEEMDKIPSYELFTVAREAIIADNYPDWFEKITDKERNIIHEST